MFIFPMLLESEIEPFSSSEHIFELKLDGHRAVLSSNHDNYEIFTRHGNPVSNRYPELREFVPKRNIVLDGEMIVTDSTATGLPKPNFEKLMERFQTTKEEKIRFLMKEKPVTFVAFDILYLDGKSLMNLPLSERKQILDKELDNSEHLVKMQYIEEYGEALFDAVKEHGLEGICIKTKNSKYIPNSRSSNWLKVLNYSYLDVWITGYRVDKFGLIASIKGESSLKTVGIIEHGSINLRRDFYNIARSYSQKEKDNFVYIQPYVKARVKFLNWTSKGFMRIPVLIEIVK